MYISIDLGGTKTRIAFSKDLHSLDSVEKFPTLQDLSALKNKITDVIENSGGSLGVKAVSFGIPGTFDIQSKRFLKVPNYKWLENIDFKYISDIFDSETKFYVNNDAALACLGEAVHGAGKSYNNVAYITLSTGVGGALVLGKKLSDHTRVYEPGHHIINITDTLSDNSGVTGSMESYLSGTGFRLRFGLAPEDCEDEKIWSEYGAILGASLVNVSAFWNPEIIVLGGSLSQKYDYFIGSTNNYLNKIDGLTLATVQKCVLEDDAGLIGGLEFISQRVA
jgi:glucokinase